MNFITSEQVWLQEYKKNKQNIWIIVDYSSGKFYLKDNKEWLTFAEFCNINKLCINSVSLRYRSHDLKINVEDYDGVYIVKSILGMMGQKSRETITVGKIDGKTVYKTIWITPELIEQLQTKDSLSDCFPEAIAKNHHEKTRII